MARRTRTTKNLAQRIDRDYFKRVFPITRWRRLLTILLVVGGVSWLGWHRIAGNPAIYSSGPIKSAHAVFGQNCAACHVSASTFSAKVTDQSCQSCHDGPVHQAQQTFTPECASCHLENATGRMGSNLVDDQYTYPRVATDLGTFEVIYAGAAGAMQAFGNRIPQDDILKIMAYLSSLRK